MACTHPPGIANGNLVSIGPFSDNSVAVYACNPNYSPQGTNSIRCSNGVWQGSLPVCATSILATNDLILWVLAGCAGFILLIMLIFFIIVCLYCCCRKEGTTVVQVQPLDERNYYRTNQIDPHHVPESDRQVVRVKSAGTQLNRHTDLRNVQPNDTNSSYYKPTVKESYNEPIILNPKKLNSEAGTTQPYTNNGQTSRGSGWMPNTKPPKENNIN